MTDHAIRDEVARALFQSDDMIAKPNFAWGDTTAVSYQRMADAAIVAHLDAQKRANRIDTVAELNALDWPMGTVIQEIHTGDCCGEKHCDFYPPLWEMAFQCGWSRAGRLYDPEDGEPRLPCRVLYRPENGS